MPLPLMPKATAVWLVDNTSLTFDQIAEFCGLHSLEVKGIADGEVAIGIQGRDPIVDGELIQDEIDRCTKDPTTRLNMAASSVPRPQARTSGPKYTPVTKRQDRPNAIMWLLRYHSELSDAQVCRLVGTTKPTINSVRERTHWNMANLKPIDPVSLGMSTQMELDEAVTKAQARQRSRERREARESGKGERPGAASAEQGGAPAETAVTERTETGKPAPLRIVPPAPEPPAAAEPQAGASAVQKTSHSIESVFGATPEPDAPEPEPTIEVFEDPGDTPQNIDPAPVDEGGDAPKEDEENAT